MLSVTATRPAALRPFTPSSRPTPIPFRPVTAPHNPRTARRAAHPHDGDLDLDTLLFNTMHLGPLLKRIEAVQRGELVDEHIKKALQERPDLPEMALAAFLAGSNFHRELVNWHEAQWAKLHELHHEPGVLAEAQMQATDASQGL